MQVNELLNYGRPISQITANMPKVVQFRVVLHSMRIMKRQLSWGEYFRFMSGFQRIKKEMLQQDFSILRQKGLTDEKFIASQVDLAAMYAMLSRIKGKEIALGAFYEMSEAVAKIAFPALMPAPEAFQACGDPWLAFKDYFLATLEADREAACHLFEVVENTDRVLQCNCTYCAWYEIAKILGVEENTSPCDPDDLFFPEQCQQIGIKYSRTQTLFKGGSCCDFRFEQLRH